MTDTTTAPQEQKDELSRADAKKVLEQMKTKLMEELEKSEAIQKQPELVERVNQVINDIHASIPPEVPKAAAPGIAINREDFKSMLEKASEQLKAVLEQTEPGKEIAGHVTSALEAAGTASPEEEKPAAPAPPPAS